MTRVQRNRARVGLILTLAVVAYVSMPLAPFLIGAAFLAVVTSIALAAYWYEKAVEVEAENMSLCFAVGGLEVDNTALSIEYDALLIRLSEVLDEHALCPVPVEPDDEPVDESAKKPRARGGVVKRTTLTVIGESIPPQRKGGKS